MSFRQPRSVLNAELASIRRSDPDVDAGDITLFTLPLVVRAAGIAVIGVVPLLVVRNGAVENSQLVPIIGSTALVSICAAVVAWLTAIVISGLIVMILYRTRPTSSSQLVARILTDSFMRIDDSTSTLAALLAAQVGVLLAVLGIAFIGESIRSSANIVDDQSLLLAWPWALVISCISWVLATGARSRPPACSRSC